MFSKLRPAVGYSSNLSITLLVLSKTTETSTKKYQISLFAINTAIKTTVYYFRKISLLFEEFEAYFEAKIHQFNNTK